MIIDSVNPLKNAHTFTPKDVASPQIRSPYTLFKNPFYTLRQILFSLELTDEDGHPVKKLSSLPLPGLDRKEKNILKKILQREISHNDPEKGIFFSTTLEDLENAFNDELVIQTLCACGTEPLKKILPLYIPRAIKRAVFFIQQNDWELPSELLEALEEFYKIFCIETDLDIRNQYLNSVLRAHDCLISHLKCHKTQPKKRKIKEIKWDSRESKIFEKIHRPHKSDKNKFALHSFQQCKIEIVHVQDITRPAVLTQGTFEFDLFPLLMKKQGKMIPKCHLKNPWIAFFDILQGFMSHIQKEDGDESLRDFSFEGQDILRIWCGYVKGCSFRHPEMTHELMKTLLKECENDPKTFSNRLEQSHKDHLPESPNSAAAFLWRVLLTLRHNVDRTFIQKVVSSAKSLWKGSEIEGLLEFICSDTPHSIEAAFALFEVGAWLKLHSGSQHMEPIPSEEPGRSFDIQVRLGEEPRAFLTHPFALRESIDFLISHPDILKKGIKLLPKIAEFTASPYSNFGLPSDYVATALNHPDSIVKRLGLLMLLAQSNINGAPNLSEPLLFQNLLSLSLTESELLILETYRLEKGFFTPLVEARNRKMSEPLALIGMLYQDPKLLPGAIQIMETLKQAPPDQLTEDHLFMFETILLSDCIEKPLEMFKLIMEKFDSSYDKSLLCLKFCQKLLNDNEPILCQYAWSCASENYIWKNTQNDKSYLKFICDLLLDLIKKQKTEVACTFFQEAVTPSFLPVKTKSHAMIRLVKDSQELSEFVVETFLDFFKSLNEKNGLLFLNMVQEKLNEENSIPLFSHLIDSLKNNPTIRKNSSYIKCASLLFLHEYQKSPRDMSLLTDLMEKLKPALKQKNKHPALIKTLKEIGFVQAAYLKANENELQHGKISPVHRFCLTKKHAVRFQIKMFQDLIEKGYFKEAFEMLRKISTLSKEEAASLLKQVQERIIRDSHLYFKWAVSPELTKLYRNAKKSSFSFNNELLRLLTEQPYSAKEAVWVQVLSEVKRNPAHLSLDLINRITKELNEIPDSKSASSKFIKKLIEILPLVLAFLEIQERAQEAFDLLDVIYLHRRTLCLPENLQSFIVTSCIQRAETSHIQAEAVLQRLLTSSIKASSPEVITLMEMVSKGYSQSNLSRSYQWLKKVLHQRESISEQDHQQVINLVKDLIAIQHKKSHEILTEIIKLYQKRKRDIEPFRQVIIATYVPEKALNFASDINLLYQLCCHTDLGINRSLSILILKLLNEASLHLQFKSQKFAAKFLSLFQKCIENMDSDDYFKFGGESFCTYSDNLTANSHGHLHCALVNFPILASNLNKRKQIRVFDHLLQKYSEIETNRIAKKNHVQHKELDSIILTAFNFIEPDTKEIFDITSEGDSHYFLMRLRMIPYFLSSGDDDNFLKCLDIVTETLVLPFQESFEQIQILNSHEFFKQNAILSSTLRKVRNQGKLIEALCFEALEYLLNTKYFHDIDDQSLEHLLRIAKACKKDRLPYDLLLLLSKKLSPFTDIESLDQRLECAASLIAKGKVKQKNVQASMLVTQSIKDGLMNGRSDLKSFLGLSHQKNAIFYLITDHESFYLYINCLINTKEEEYLLNAEKFVNILFKEPFNKFLVKNELKGAIQLARALNSKDADKLSEAIQEYIFLLEKRSIDSRNSTFHNLAIPHLTKSLFDKCNFKCYSKFILMVFDQNFYLYHYFLKNLPTLVNDLSTSSHLERFTSQEQYTEVLMTLFSQLIHYRTGTDDKKIIEATTQFIIFLSTLEPPLFIAPDDLEHFKKRYFNKGIKVEQLKMATAFLDNTFLKCSGENFQINFLAVFSKLLRFKSFRGHSNAMLFYATNIQSLRESCPHYHDFCSLLKQELNRFYTIDAPDYLPMVYLINFLKTLKSKEELNETLCQLLNVFRDMISVKFDLDEYEKINTIFIDFYGRLLSMEQLKKECFSDSFREHLKYFSEFVFKNDLKEVHSVDIFYLFNQSITTLTNRISFHFQSKPCLTSEDIQLLSKIVRIIVTHQMTPRQTREDLEIILDALLDKLPCQELNELIFQILCLTRNPARTSPKVPDIDTDDLQMKLIQTIMSDRGIHSLTHGLILLAEYTNNHGKPLNYECFYKCLKQYSYKSCLVDQEIIYRYKFYFEHLINDFYANNLIDNSQLFSDYMLNLIEIFSIHLNKISSPDDPQNLTKILFELVLATFELSFKYFTYESHFAIWRLLLLCVAKSPIFNSPINIQKEGTLESHALNRIYDYLFDLKTFIKQGSVYRSLLIDNFFRILPDIAPLSKVHEHLVRYNRIKLDNLAFRSGIEVPEWKDRILEAEKKYCIDDLSTTKVKQNDL